MASLMELFISITGDSSSYKKAMSDAGDITNAFSDVFSKLESKLGATAVFTAISTAIIESSKKFEDASIKIERATGAAGQSLSGLEDTFTHLYKTSAQSADSISAAMITIAQKTSATGLVLEDLT